MTELMQFAAVMLAGALLGAFYFGGLWWTVRRGVRSSHPALFFLGSLVLRTIAVLAGFYCASYGDWRKLTASLVGFLMARVAMRHCVHSPAQTQQRLLAERVL